MTVESAPAPRCANHPERETLLRCNRCEKPICTECAVLTEVGYRCRECVRGLQASYYNGKPADLVVAAPVTLALGAVAGVPAYFFLGILGIFFAFIGAFVAGPFAGGLIAEAARRSVGKRRVQRMKIVVAGCTVIGILLGAVLGFLFIGPVNLVSLLALLVFAGLAGSTAYARLI